MILNLYIKTTGCQQCVMTKRAMVSKGLAETTTDGELTSTMPGLEIKTTYLDTPENTHLIKSFQEEGLTQAPILMLNQPITIDGHEITEWTGFQPTMLDILHTHLQDTFTNKGKTA